MKELSHNKIMDLLIFGNDIKEIEELAKKVGFNVVANNPDIIASFGGDGTFMLAEKLYPSIPKFCLRKSRVCKKCSEFSNEEVLQKVFDKKYEVNEEIKVEATSKGSSVVGLNEIIVHNKDPRRAIRYEIFINGKKYGDEIIGDGVAISTPYGSTGYYRSITDSFFEVGLGIAFNNSTEQSDHMVIKEDSEIKIKILRGPAMVYADNNEEEIELDAGDEILIRKSKERARIIRVL